MGINYAVKTEFYLKHKFLFDNKGHEEDWRFLSKMLNHTNKTKVTDKIYYMAPSSEHLTEQVDEANPDPA